jgi:outer membrane protein TolC
MFLLLASVAAALAAQPSFRSEFVRRALDRAPAVAASDARTRAAALSAERAPPLAPVMVETGLAPLSLGEMNPGLSLGASWELPLDGMPLLEQSRARSEIDMRAAAAAMTRAELAARASSVLDELVAARSAVATADALVTRLEAAHDAVNRRVAAGLATPSAAAMCAMAVVQSREDGIGARRRLRDALARARVIGGDPSLEADAVPGDLGPVLGAGDHNPGLPAVAMAEADAAMAATMVTMAERERLPMVGVMTAYDTSWVDPMHRWMAGVEVAVPLGAQWRRDRIAAARAEVAAAEARRNQAQEAAALERALAASMVEEARAMLDTARTQMAPLAEQRVGLARTAWEAGQGSLSDWLTAESDRARAQQSILDAEAMLHQAEAMTAMATGCLAALPGEVP